MAHPDITRELLAFTRASWPHTASPVIAGSPRPVRDALRISALLADVTETRVDVLLERVGLADAADQRVGGYSLGMRQRLALAQGMLADPAVLIADEPANGLDPAGISWLRRLLRELADGGTTVLYSSHLLSEAERLIDDVIVLAHGPG